ncbi:pentapeptide repeat-containing protein [Nocardiopsis sp. NPDC055551]
MRYFALLVSLATGLSVFGFSIFRLREHFIEFFRGEAWAWSLLSVGVIIIFSSLVLWGRSIDSKKGEDNNIFRPWWFVAGLLFILIIMASAVALMLSISDAGQELQAVQGGLTVGVGVGGLLVLAMASRRQWHNERVHDFERGEAKKREYDEVERRATEIYSKAIDQLGDENLTVRLGGVYALERLGREHKVSRKTIVNVLCSYLRSNTTVTVGPESPEDDEKSKEIFSSKEIEVKKAVQSVLLGALKRHNAMDVQESEKISWGDIYLDLQGAQLHDFRVPHHVRLAGNFMGAKFYGPTSMKFVSLTNAIFDEARFKGECSIHGAELAGGVSFRGSVFEGVFDAPKATVKSADFFGAKFLSLTKFDGSWFYKINLRSSNFVLPPDFSKVEVHGDSKCEVLIDGWIVDPKNTFNLIRAPKKSRTSSAIKTKRKGFFGRLKIWS